jgi:hypothetical protein
MQARDQVVREDEVRRVRTVLCAVAVESASKIVSQAVAIESVGVDGATCGGGLGHATDYAACGCYPEQGMSLEMLRELAGPTGQWVSWGTVDDESPDGKPVEFDPDYGPLVDVKLHPSAAHVRCRVASAVAGNGEAEYYPFIGGDEVLVAIPEGDERAGCTIIGRGNNQLDKFPMTVAGNDVTGNQFGFRRMRAPYVIETAAAYGIRNAMNGVLFMLGQDGTVVLKDAYTGYLSLNPDWCGLQTTDDTSDLPTISPTATMMTLQLNKQSSNILLSVESATGFARLTLGKQSSALMTNGTFAVAAGGVLPTEHVATVEGVANLLTAIVMGIGAAGVGGLPGLAVLAAAQTLVAAAVPIAAAPGTGTLNPAIYSAIKTALLAKAPNPTGAMPNIGCPGFVAG